MMPTPHLRGLVVALAILLSPSLASAQVVLPFFEGFEGTSGQTLTNNALSIPGAPGWSFETDAAGDGRLRFAAGAGYYRNGSKAATLDRSGSGSTVTNYLILTLDMTNYDVNNDAIVVDFSHMHHGEEAHVGDRVWARGSNTDPWVEIFDVHANQGSTGAYIDFMDVDISNALSAASQQFSATFQLRFGQEDDFASSSPTTTDGRTYDDIRIRNVLGNDVGVSAIIAPSDLICGDAAQDIVVEVGNFGAFPQSNIPVAVTVSGDIVTSFSTTVAGPLAGNQTAQVVVGPIDTSAGVEITIDATTNLGTDEDTANDAASVQRTLPSLLVDVPTAPADVCPGDTASITITAETDIDYQLFDVPTGGMPLDKGNPLTTPPVDAQTIFYVERTNIDESNGAADDTIGGGAQYPTFNDGLVFDVTEPVVLTSVKVIPGSVGNVTVRVLDASDTEVGSGTTTIEAGDVGMLTEVDVGVALAVGNGYKVDATGSTVITLFRNSDGALYPYNSDSVSITGAKNGLPDAYYFFYDWVVTQDSPVCADQRTPVVVDVDPGARSADLTVDIAGPDAADPGTDVQYVITVTNNGPTVATGVEVDLATPADVTFVENTGDCATAFPCALGDLLPAQTRIITATFTTDEAFNGLVDFTASASTATSDPSPGDESDTQSTQFGEPMMAGVGGGGTSTGTGAGNGTGGGDATSTGSGVFVPPPPGVVEDGGGCTVGERGAKDEGAPWALLAAGLGVAVLRRRRQR